MRGRKEIFILNIDADGIRSSVIPKFPRTAESLATIPRVASETQGSTEHSRVTLSSSFALSMGGGAGKP